MIQELLQPDQAIHHLLTRLGMHASGCEVRAALARQGIQVSLPEIYAVRNRLLLRSSATPKELRDPGSLAPD
jgi:hypothetical protein